MLAANGAAVALVARRADKLQAAKAQIEKAGGKAIAVEADVLDRAAMNRAFDQAEKALGTVTILVNNAGVAHSTRAIDVTEDEWNHVVRTNLDAVFFWAQEGARRMLAAEQEGRDRQHRLGAGLRRLEGHHRLCHRQGRRHPDDQGARQRARLQGRARQRHRAGLVRHRHQPRLSCRARPGKKLTRDIPVGRFGQDGDLDGALLLLASDAGSYIAGATIVCDGGQMVALRG